MEGFLVVKSDEGEGLWPSMVDVYNLYIAMQTQQRSTGGFDYSALPAVMDITGIGKDSDEKFQIFEDFRTMENEHLIVLNERREQEAKKAKRR